MSKISVFILFISISVGTIVADERLVVSVAGLKELAEYVSKDGHGVKMIPILLGYSMPGASEISSPVPEKSAENITIINRTSLLIMVGGKAENFVVTTDDFVSSNKGTNITIV